MRVYLTDVMHQNLADTYLKRLCTFTAKWFYDIGQRSLLLLNESIRVFSFYRSSWQYNSNDDYIHWPPPSSAASSSQPDFR